METRAIIAWAIAAVMIVASVVGAIAWAHSNSVKNETARITACVNSGGDWTTLPGIDRDRGCVHK